MNLSKLKNYCGLVVIPLLLGYTNLHAQQTAQMTSGGVGYWEFLPDDYNTTTKEYPLLLFLHGIGERGNGISPGDLDKVDNLGPPRKIKDGHDMKFQAGERPDLSSSLLSFLHSCQQRLIHGLGRLIRFLTISWQTIEST